MLTPVAISIGSGLGISETTGEMIVLSLSQVTQELIESQDPLDRAVGALVLGDLDGAEVQLNDAPTSVRLSSLRGELARLAGRTAEAVAIFESILADPVLHPLRRASVLQHLGKAEMARGSRSAAIGCFEESLRLRQLHKAPSDQIQSSELAIRLSE